MVLGVQFIGRGPVRGSSRSLTFVAKTESGQSSPLSCQLTELQLHLVTLAVHMRGVTNYNTHQVRNSKGISELTLIQLML